MAVLLQQPELLYLRDTPLTTTRITVILKNYKEINKALCSIALIILSWIGRRRSRGEGKSKTLDTMIGKLFNFGPKTMNPPDTPLIIVDRIHLGIGQCLRVIDLNIYGYKETPC